MKTQKYSQGQHPKSRANLTYHEGRPLTFGKRKKQHGITVTEEGWEGVKDVVKELGCSSVSDFLEKVGRGEVKVSA
jgi:hypothetical protein